MSKFIHPIELRTVIVSCIKQNTLVFAARGDEDEDEDERGESGVPGDCSVLAGYSWNQR